MHPLVYPKSLSRYKTFPSPQKVPYACYSEFLSLPHPQRQPLFLYFCFNCRLVLSVFYISGTIQDMLFCVWFLLCSILSLRVISVFPCISSLYLFIAEQYSIVRIYKEYQFFKDGQRKRIPRRLRRDTEDIQKST